MRVQKRIWILIVLALGLSLSQSPDALAQKKSAGKKVDVKDLKKQYWSQDEDYDVVQNRVYTKARRIELGVYGGFVFSDPFLSMKTIGLSLGYHFNEYLSFHALYWKINSSASSALEKFEEQALTTTNTNHVESFIGGELAWSLIYGKLSLLGKKILYYDLHMMVGAGQTGTESGNYFTPHIGIGQQIYISQHVAIRFDYRLQRYKEVLLEKANQLTLGQPASERTNFSNVLTVGFSFFF